MKILIFINSLGAGGAERSMVDYAKFLAKKDSIELKFLCLFHQEIGFEREVDELGIPCIFFENANSYPEKLKFLNKIINIEKPDIFLSVLAEEKFLVGVVWLLNKTGKIIQSLVNTPYTEERKRDSKLPGFKYKMAKKFDEYSGRLNKGIHYHAITREVLDHYDDFLNIGDNYSLIYRGREENRFVKDSGRENSGVFEIINVGRQEFAKGQLDILKAMKYLLGKEQIGKIRLKILGRDGKYSSVLNDYIIENKLEPYVEIIGFVNNVEEHLANADAFIFPSYYEGLGGALIEGFAAELPCICSNIPVLKEVVGSDNGALFCDPGDFECLGENILKIYKDKDLRKRLSTYSYERFNEKFRMDKINEEMLTMYENVIDN